MSHLIDSLSGPLAILCIFGGPFLLVAFMVYVRSRTRMERYKLMQGYLNQGLPVPPELLHPRGFREMGREDFFLQNRARHELRRGIRMIFVGIGIMAACFIYSPHERYWGWGVIPLIIGIGRIVSSRVAGNEPPPPAN